MKRVLSVVLALMLILSIAAVAGCSKKEEAAQPEDAAPADTPETSAEPAPDAAPAPASDLPVTDYYGKTCPELIEEGVKPVVGLTFPVLSDPFLMEIINGVEEKFQAEGFDTLAVSAENNITKQIEQIENFVTMGAVAILEGAMDINALNTCNTAAVDAGVIVTSLGAVPEEYDISGGIATDWVGLGEAEAAMVIAYVDHAYPDAGEGDVHASFAMNSSLSDPKKCAIACREGVQADPRINLVFEKDLVMEIDTGFTFAEESLTADPDTTLFVMYIEASAIGANNYIATIPNVDFSKYAIFCTSGGEDFSRVMAMSETNESAVRGTIKYGGSDPAVGLFQTAYDMLMGNAAIPNWYPEPFWTENTFGYEIPA